MYTLRDQTDLKKQDHSRMNKKCVKSYAVSAVIMLATLMSGCNKSGYLDDDPLLEYDDGNDERALSLAIDDLGTKYDLPSRLFIAQYYLSRYMRTADASDAENLKKHYRGVGSLEDLSRSNKVYDELMWLGKYLDAAILLYVDKKPDAAKALLDSYCPMSDFSKKMNCHADHIEYFDDSAQTSLSRDNLEKAFLQISAVGDVYHHEGAAGHALWLLANYDVTYAAKRAEAFKVRNTWNDFVMTEYCRAVDEYQDSTAVRDHEKYAAAYNHSSCGLYVDLTADDSSG